MEMKMSQYFVDTNGQISESSASASNDRTSKIDTNLNRVATTDFITKKNYHGLSNIRVIFTSNKRKKIDAQKFIAEERLKTLCNN